MFNARPQNWFRWLDLEWFQDRAEKLAAFTHQFSMKSAISAGNTYFVGHAYQEYRWFPKDMFLSENESLYIYGDKLGFFNFRDHDVGIIILRNAQFSRGMRILFNAAWDHIAQVPPPDASQDGTEGDDDRGGDKDGRHDTDGDDHTGAR